MKRRSLFAFVAAALAACVHAAEPQPLVIGLIASRPVSEVVASWRPLADALSRELKQPVRLEASANYADVLEALKSGQVQVAWINNKMAIEVVEQGVGHVFAQMVRADGTRGYQSVILAAKDGPVHSLADIIDKGASLRFGMGDPKSTSGYVVPNYYVFARNKIAPDKHFAKITYSAHDENFKLLAAGAADAVTNNTEELPRYQKDHPQQFAKMKVVWESPVIPNDPIVYRADLPEATKEGLRRFFAHYGHTAPEKAALASINGLSRFAESGDYQLRPVADIELFQALTRAMALQAKDPAAFTSAMEELTRRAAKLDSVLAASRVR